MVTDFEYVTWLLKFKFNVEHVNNNYITIYKMYITCKKMRDNLPNGSNKYKRREIEDKSANLVFYVNP